MNPALIRRNKENVPLKFYLLKGPWATLTHRLMGRCGEGRSHPIWLMKQVVSPQKMWESSFNHCHASQTILLLRLLEHYLILPPHWLLTAGERERDLRNSLEYTKKKIEEKEESKNENTLIIYMTYPTNIIPFSNNSNVPIYNFFS